MAKKIHFSVLTQGHMAFLTKMEEKEEKFFYSRCTRKKNLKEKFGISAIRENRACHVKLIIL